MGRRDGQVGLLNFKEADGDKWVDSNEGGVYAYLIVPTPVGNGDLEDELERCMVETFPMLRHAHLVSSSGHIEVDAVEDDYWPDLFETVNENGWINHRHKHPTPWGHHIDGKSPDEVRSMTENYIRSYEGGPFYAVIYLGSSGPSVHEDKEELPPYGTPYFFWPVYTREDLTDEGKTLYDTLHKLYQTEPVILLFLDT